MVGAERAPLWRPDAGRAAESNLTKFVAGVSTTHGIHLPDYSSLHDWSVQHAPDFWTALWDFCGVRGSKGPRAVVDHQCMPGARWFPDGQLNYAENLLRRDDDEPAIIAHLETGQRRSLTWCELRDAVASVAAGLRQAGVEPGDRVAGCLPNTPETVIAMLGAASIGAVWSSCSPDFGIEEVVERFAQIEPKVVFVCGAHLGNGRRIDASAKMAAIVARLPTVRVAVNVPLDDSAPAAIAGTRDYASFVVQGAELSFPQFPFNQPLFIVFSSGTTGKPKCIVHGAGGTLLQHLKEHQLHSDIRMLDRVFYFTTCGWMMWNWLVGALASRATVVLYEGSAFAANGNVLFDMADADGITHLGASAKYFDTIEKLGVQPRLSHRLAELRALFSTGSPLLPASFDYVYREVKSDVCLSSISGGTDIISCFVLGNPLLPVWSGEAQCAGLGMDVRVLDDLGRPVFGAKGELACMQSFPSMPLGFWNDVDGEKYRAAYFERFPGVWHHGDYAEMTLHPGQSGIVIYGRSDAVLKPGGVRIGTAEIYRYVQQIEEVADSLVVGQQWRNDVRIVLFVKLNDGLVLDDALTERIRTHMRRSASPSHVPALVLQVTDIPRTRSNKVVELIVRDLIHGRPIRNKDALVNPECLEQFDHPALHRDSGQALTEPDGDASRLLIPVWARRGLIGNELSTDFLTPVEVVANHVAPLAAAIPEQSAQLAAIEEISLEHIVDALRQLGWSFQPGERINSEQLRSRLGILSVHHRLLQRVLDILCEAGIVERQLDVWQVLRALPEADAVSRSQCRSVLQGFELELALVERCGRHLAEVLTGRRDALSLLFPDGDATEMAGLYRQSPTFGSFNALVPHAVRYLLQGLPANRAVRILELGAGTGGTTAHILPTLDIENAEYFMTDVGGFFLNNARAAFAAYPFVQYELLDVERGVAEQAWPHGKFDLIIATNVLHATADLHGVLTNVRHLLQPGGALVLLEGTSRRRWLDITFGLTDGWWKFQDLHLRPSYPLLTPEQWRQVLLQTGFDSVASVPPQGRFLMPQAITMARATRAQACEAGQDTWLLIGLDDGVKRVAAALEARGIRCVLLNHAARVSIEPGRWAADLTQPQQVKDVLHSMFASTAPQIVVLVGAACGPDTLHESIEKLADQVREHVQTALNVVQSILAASWERAPRLWLLTRDATSVEQSQVHGVVHATLSGFGLAMAVEHPELRCSRLDLPDSATEADMHALCDELINDGVEDRVALRAGRRFVQRLQLPGESAAGLAAVAIVADCTYLLTGGLGPLGLLFAQWLVDRGARSIVLVGRTLTRSGADQAIKAMQCKGATVITAAVDVADPDALQSLFQRIRNECPPLRGVMHCAGLLDDGVVIEQRWNRFAKVFAPKVLGAWNLHRLTERLSLDFFVLFSSTAAIMGHAGQANHSAANAFMDSLAHARRAAGLVATSINWGPWSEIGAASAAVTLQRLAAQGVRPISPEQGVAALERTLQLNLTQSVAADIDVKMARRSPARARLVSELQVVQPDVSRDSAQFHQMLDAAPREQRTRMLVEHIRTEVARMASISDPSRIADDAGFFELGMDSLSSVELRNSLQRSLHKTLPATLAFDYPNIDLVVTFVREHVYAPDYFEAAAPAFEHEEILDLPVETDEELLDDAIERELAELNSLLKTSR